MKRVYIVGTADTKGEELEYVASRVKAAGAPALLVDVGTREPQAAVDISASEVAACHPQGRASVLISNDRGTAVEAMGIAFGRYITQRADIAGIIGLGGGGGTSIITAGMRALPIGLPKLMVSTLAAGDVGQFVGGTDITMMYSVTDVAGLNRISRTVLANAAHAIAGMALHTPPAVEAKPAVGLTMFGITTPCVSQIVSRLNQRFDCLVFHATGIGGRSMEKLVDSNLLVGAIDVTLTEITDYIVGGVLPAAQDRLDAIARSRIPYVASAGALDTVNFWASDSVPERFRGRLLYRHNPNVTLMRTTVAESQKIGRWIAEKLNMCEGPVRFLIPEGGISSLDAPGQPFHDFEADAALFDSLETTLKQTATRRLLRIPFHINDPAFSAVIAQTFLELF